MWACCGCSFTVRCRPACLLPACLPASLPCPERCAVQGGSLSAHVAGGALFNSWLLAPTAAGKPADTPFNLPHLSLDKDSVLAEQVRGSHEQRTGGQERRQHTAALIVPPLTLCLLRHPRSAAACCE
jgi:hypothetical protein